MKNSCVDDRLMTLRDAPKSDAGRWGTYLISISKSEMKYNKENSNVALGKMETSAALSQTDWKEKSKPTDL